MRAALLRIGLGCTLTVAQNFPSVSAKPAAGSKLELVDPSDSPGSSRSGMFCARAAPLCDRSRVTAWCRPKWLNTRIDADPQVHLACSRLTTSG